MPRLDPSAHLREEIGNAPLTGLQRRRRGLEIAPACGSSPPLVVNLTVWALSDFLNTELESPTRLGVKKILVVEDNRLDQELIRDCLGESYALHFVAEAAAVAEALRDFARR